MLRKGRLAIFGDFQYLNASQRFHVIAIYRLFGDGTAGGTTISFIDPFVGRYQNMTFDRFYDAEGGQSFLVDPHFILGR